MSARARTHTHTHTHTHMADYNALALPVQGNAQTTKRTCPAITEDAYITKSCSAITESVLALRSLKVCSFTALTESVLTESVLAPGALKVCSQSLKVCSHL